MIFLNFFELVNAKHQIVSSRKEAPDYGDQLKDKFNRYPIFRDYETAWKQAELMELDEAWRDVYVWSD